MNWEAILLSLKLAVCVAGILLVAGLPIAYWVAFSRRRWKFLVEAVVALPLVLPPTVLGYYILVGLGPRTFLRQPSRASTGGSWKLLGRSGRRDWKHSSV